MPDGTAEAKQLYEALEKRYEIMRSLL